MQVTSRTKMTHQQKHDLEKYTLELPEICMFKNASWVVEMKSEARNCMD